MGIKIIKVEEVDEKMIEDLTKPKKEHLLFCDNPACFATHLAKKNYPGKDACGGNSE